MSSASDARIAALALVVATGCNAAFDLAPTTGTHEFFDAAPDAPYRCPGFGETPRFQRDLVQVLAQDCSTYSLSARADLALATCKEPARGIYVGAPDGPLTPAVGFAPPEGGWLDEARVAADGDLALASQCTADGPCALFVYRRAAEGAWVDGRPTGIALAATDTFSAPSLGPDRRVLVSRAASVDELAEQPDGSWRFVRSHAVPAGATNVSLGADGLRMITVARPSPSEPVVTVYLDRARLDDPFAQPRTLDVPHEGDQAIAEDCGRVYFTALRSVFYVARE